MSHHLQQMVCAAAHHIPTRKCNHTLSACLAGHPPPHTYHAICSTQCVQQVTTTTPRHSVVCLPDLQPPTNPLVKTQWAGAAPAQCPSNDPNISANETADVLYPSLIVLAEVSTTVIDRCIWTGQVVSNNS
jgi:hypothetical protein